MTAKQIEAVKDALHKKYYGNGCVWPGNLKKAWTKKDEILKRELMCREMINSILIYGGSCDKDSYSYERYLKTFIIGDVWTNKENKNTYLLLTEARVDELIAEQKADFAKAEVGFAGYDGEGVSYNYCHWEDD